MSKHHALDYLSALGIFALLTTFINFVYICFGPNDLFRPSFISLDSGFQNNRVDSDGVLGKKAGTKWTIPDTEAVGDNTELDAILKWSNNTVNILKASGAFGPHRWRNGKELNVEAYRRKVLPQSYSGGDTGVFACANQTLLHQSSNFLLSAEEIPRMPGLKNPCFCANGFAKVQRGRGLVRCVVLVAHRPMVGYTGLVGLDHLGIGWIVWIGGS